MITKEQILNALKMVFDPEIPVNIVDLGLVYDIGMVENSNVVIKMTMTSPTCPEAEELLNMARMAAESVAGAGNVKMELVWEPAWDLSRMSAVAKAELDLTENGW